MAGGHGVTPVWVAKGLRAFCELGKAGLSGVYNDGLVNNGISMVGFDGRGEGAR
ncbi:hypothetical protein KCP77_08105 [Salmonella enterica subsp. enterica]|nr:hypothetical protein KCP77_08105 [Salmonella enterica subsp. enterica]